MEAVRIDYVPYLEEEDIQNDSSSSFPRLVDAFRILACVLVEVMPLVMGIRQAGVVACLVAFQCSMVEGWLEEDRKIQK